MSESAGRKDLTTHSSPAWTAAATIRTARDTHSCKKKGEIVRKGQRPAKHFRTIQTKEGPVKRIINPEIPKVDRAKLPATARRPLPAWWKVAVPRKDIFLPPEETFKEDSTFYNNLAYATRQASARTRYGTRTETPEQEMYKLVWSNGAQKWDAYHSTKPAGKPAELDANEILVNSRSKEEADLIAEKLPVLPLYYGSTEAGMRGQVNTTENILTWAQAQYEKKLAEEKKQAEPSSPSWKGEVIANGSGEWVGNAFRFATQAEAQKYIFGLRNRWSAVRQVRVVPSEDPPNYRWVDGKGEERLP